MTEAKYEDINLETLEYKNGEITYDKSAITLHKDIFNNKNELIGVDYRFKDSDKVITYHC